ncbi:MAG TPA: SIMPL domain-containing protein [Mycobacteriales bacterium]|nr:SIMPL domain-containing protein [Mycobacteriales bacterium]
MATVTVRGRAELDVEPDRVRLGYVVQAEAAAGADALTLVAERSAAADEALDRAGDLLLLRRPAAVTLTPVWADNGTVTGQAARRFVLVEARAVGPLGELLAALVAVPGSTVESTEWVVDPGNPVHARLRAAAVADARQRAADYAQAADLRLGALEWITEPDVRPGEPGWASAQAVSLGFARKDAGGSPVLELRPEPVAVSTAVDVRWALLG